MRFPGLATCLAAMAMIVVLAYADAPRPSLATSPPSAQRFSIDMDPHFLTTNTATSLSTTETCARMNENNVLDGDEDFVDTVEFDVTATGIPASNPMTGYAYSLIFPDTHAQIVYQQPMMIGPPIGILNNSEPLPDTTSPFNVSVLDPSGPAESGSGVLDRLRIQSFSSSVTVSILTLTNAVHMDANNDAWAPDAIDSANIEVNTGGCPLFVDIEMLSLSLTSVNPVSVGVDTTVTVDEIIRNNSQYAANTDAVTTFAVPSGCTLNGATGTVTLNAALGVLPGMTNLAHQETPVLRCTTLGPHTMPVTACGVLDDLISFDIQTANNCETQNLNFDVIAPPGTDADGDGVWDANEFNCGVSTLGVSLRPEMVNGFDDDGDGLTDEALPAGSETRDCDGDGYTGAAEAHVFQATDRDQRDCGMPDWPADFVDGGSPNRVTLADIASFVAPVRHFNTNPGDGGYDVRWDLVQGGTPYTINLQDLASPVAVRPAKFGGSRAFNGLACGQIGCTNATWCTDPSTPAGVELRLETDRLVYHAGEPVKITLVATNTGGSNVTLNFPNDCTALFSVVNTWSSDLCLICVPGPGCTSGTLAPGVSITYSSTWNQVNTLGETVTRGDYQVIAVLEEDSCGSFQCWVPPIPPPPTAYHYIRLTQ